VSTSALALTGFLAGLHAALPALDSWVHPNLWPGYLPPMTLLSFLLGAFASIVSLTAIRRPPY
jgi:hypothetical protein